jgi:hypothetical protein
MSGLSIILIAVSTSCLLALRATDKRLEMEDKERLNRIEMARRAARDAERNRFDE